jgi:hypothetical protein
MTIKSDHFKAEHFKTLAEAKAFANRMSRRNPTVSKAKTGYIVIYDK